MATNGYYLNPSHRYCFEACSACFRCGQRGKYAKCAGCSGHHDPFGVIDPHPDDTCTCTEGKLRFVDKNGSLRIVPYKTDPFKGEVTLINKTADENDWDDYVDDLREKINDPNFDPVQVVDMPTRRSRAAAGFKYLGDAPPQ